MLYIKLGIMVGCGCWFGGGVRGKGFFLFYVIEVYVNWNSFFGLVFKF